MNGIDTVIYKMCKVRTDILNPFDEKTELFLKNSKQLKNELEIDDNHMMWSLDIQQLFPMIPVGKTPT